MRKDSIKYHLQPYSILKKRLTTINHAFASAIALNNDYNEKIVVEALKTLGQDPQKDLWCAYCDRPAETWDHVYGLVKNHQYYGYGHIIGNLLPCCKKCNSEKGNQRWERFLKKINLSEDVKEKKIAILKKYFSKYLPERYGHEDIKILCPDEVRKYESFKRKIIKYMKEADKVATLIRQKVKDKVL